MRPPCNGPRLGLAEVLPIERVQRASTRVGRLLLELRPTRVAKPAVACMASTSTLASCLSTATACELARHPQLASCRLLMLLARLRQRTAWARTTGATGAIEVASEEIRTLTSFTLEALAVQNAPT